MESISNSTAVTSNSPSTCFTFDSETIPHLRRFKPTKHVAKMRSDRVRRARRLKSRCEKVVRADLIRLYRLELELLDSQLAAYESCDCEICQYADLHDLRLEDGGTFSVPPAPPRDPKMVSEDWLVHVDVYLKREFISTFQSVLNASIESGAVYSAHIELAPPLGEIVCDESVDNESTDVSLLSSEDHQLTDPCDVDRVVVFEDVSSLSLVRTYCGS